MKSAALLSRYAAILRAGFSDFLTQNFTPPMQSHFVDVASSVDCPDQSLLTDADGLCNVTGNARESCKNFKKCGRGSRTRLSEYLIPLQI